MSTNVFQKEQLFSVKSAIFKINLWNKALRKGSTCFGLHRKQELRKPDSPNFWKENIPMVSME